LLKKTFPSEEKKYLQKKRNAFFGKRISSKGVVTKNQRTLLCICLLPGRHTGYVLRPSCSLYRVPDQIQSLPFPYRLFVAVSSTGRSPTIGWETAFVQTGGNIEEHVQWANIMGVKDIGTLNKKIQNGLTKDLILTSEAFHSRRYAEIADKIHKHKNDSNWF